MPNNQTTDRFNVITVMIFLFLLVFSEYSYSSGSKGNEDYHPGYLPTPQYKTPEESKNASQSTMREIYKVSSEIRKQSDIIDKLLSDIDRITDEIESTKKRKSKVIGELRDGYYCSECNRSATEIKEQEGEGFEEHLQKVKGKKIRISESIIGKKAEEFNSIIHKKENELEKTKDKKTKVSDERYRNKNLIYKLVDNYKNAMNSEKNLIEKEWDKNVKKHKNDLSELEKMFNAVKKAQMTSEFKKDRDKAEIWKNYIGIIGKNEYELMREKEMQYSLKIGDYNQRKELGPKEVLNCFKNLKDMTNPYFTLMTININKISIPVDSTWFVPSIKDGGFVEITGDSIGVKKEIVNNVSVVYQSSYDWFRDLMKLKYCLEVGDLFSICAEHTNLMMNDEKLDISIEGKLIEELKKSKKK